MTDEGRRDDADTGDPHDDPFGDHYTPELSVAYAAKSSVSKLLEEGTRLAAEATTGLPAATNAVARTAREVVRWCLDDLQRLGDEIGRSVERAKLLVASGASCADEVNVAVDAYALASDAAALLHGQLGLVADPVETEIAEEPLPDPLPWEVVSNKTEEALTAWATRVRSLRGQLLVLTPSAGTGKTRAKIKTALEESAARHRVIFAAWTKEILKTEVLKRFEDQATENQHAADENTFRRDYRRVRLHVITGRDKDTCFKWDNVLAVQNHGYPAGSAVCPHCEHHPDEATFSGIEICEYFLARKRAQLDAEIARKTSSEPPIILTTHAALVSSRQHGEGLYGKFWGADTVMIDEDPTSAFEPTVILTEKQLQYEDETGRFRDLAVAAELMREAINLAKIEREQAGHTPTPIHHPKYGSSYCARDLKDLLHRVVMGPVGVKLGLRGEEIEVFRNAADKGPGVASGSLYGQNSEEEINRIVPPFTLATMSEMICDEYDFEESLRAAIGQAVYGPRSKKPVPVSLPKDLAYHVRLEYTAPSVDESGGWRFVGQDFSLFHKKTTEASDELKEKLAGKKASRMKDVDKDATLTKSTEPNIVIGDAYANVEHYRQLFNKPAPRDGSPDPVEVVKLVAYFHKDSIVARIRTQASMKFYEDEGGWQEIIPLLTAIAENFQGKRVLWYGHSDLRDRFIAMMEHHDWFGCHPESTFEHWWGGRGKDEYAHYDAVVTISDPVQNIGAQLHICNARAFRDSRQAIKATGKKSASEIAQLAQRIRFVDARHGGEHAVRNDANHPRMTMEHERQNMGELMQAINRVRGVQNPKTHVVLGEVEFSRDILASTTVIKDGVRGVRSDDIVTTGYLTEHEIIQAMMAVSEQLLGWSPEYIHGFLAVTLRTVVHGDEKPSAFFVDKSVLGVDDGIGVKRLIRNTDPIVSAGLSPTPSARGGLTAVPEGRLNGTDKVANAMDFVVEVPGSGSWLKHVPTLLDRIWTPPPWWELANIGERQRNSRVRKAADEVASRFSFKGFYRPTWYTRPGPGYRFFSNLQWQKARNAFAEIMEDRYGPMSPDGDYVVAPRRLTRIPF